MIRWCDDIGMFAIDRGRSSCVWKTTFCIDRCYNKKFYTMNIGLDTRDVKNDEYWDNLTGRILRDDLARKRKQTKRFRFCTRGEPFATKADVHKVYGICKNNPNTKFWAPTRAWRKQEMLDYIINILDPLDNFYLTCSIDPTTTDHDFEELDRLGLSTGFFGNDKDYPFDVKYVKCPNKWGNKELTCANCNMACFTHKQTHHWLKSH